MLKYMYKQYKYKKGVSLYLSIFTLKVLYYFNIIISLNEYYKYCKKRWSSRVTSKITPRIYSTSLTLFALPHPSPSNKS